MALTPRRCLSAPTLLVLFCFMAIYCVDVFLVLDPGLGSTVPGVLNGLLLSSFLILALLSYAGAVCTDPGGIPPGWLPDIEAEEQQGLVEVKRDGNARYCNKCECYKPPRAHHCRICKRCVLKMDHHCIWINNCVGHYNYKYFVLFVFYVWAASTQSLLLLAGSLWASVTGDIIYSKKHVSWKGREGNGSESVLPAVLQVLCAVFLAPLVIALSVLLTWHVYLILQNKTTIEHHEGVRAKWLAKKQGTHYRHPYDLGMVTNLQSILGPHAMLWWLPLAHHLIGDGVAFRTAAQGSAKYEEALRPSVGHATTELPLTRESLGLNSPIGGAGNLGRFVYDSSLR